MSFERWGTLSVNDHNDVNGLVANVILFDRLVIPMFTEAEDRDEDVYWSKRGWDVEQQKKRVEQLGELAIPCAWDMNRRAGYSQAFSLLKQLRSEASIDEEYGFAVTRWLLTQKPQFELPKHVYHADVVLGYSSETNALNELGFEHMSGVQVDETAQIGVLLAHALDIPDLQDPEESLAMAIEVSQDSEYRSQRAALHEFQCASLARGISPQAIVNELSDRSRELNSFLEKEKIPVRKKAGGVLLKVGAGLVTLNLVSAIGALMDLFQLSQDIKMEPVFPRRLEPVASFHELKARTGIKFTLK